MKPCWCAECAPRQIGDGVESITDDELARWTAAGVDDPSITEAQLHAALTVVRDLLGVLDLKAHMFQPSQDAIWRARQLLEQHGVAP